MECNHNIRVLGLTGCSGNTMIFFILLFFISPLTVFANDDEHPEIIIPSYDNTLKVNEESGIIENLTYKTIKDIQESNLLGELVDMYLPNRIVTCYIFHFKKEGTIYQIAALPESDVPDRNLEEINLEQFYAIGYYGIVYPNGKKRDIFRGPSRQTPFDLLHNLNPENYISINEIEIMLGIDLNLSDKGGFLSPFFLYRCNLEKGMLSLLASPSEDKTKSFFLGGWSFVQK